MAKRAIGITSCTSGYRRRGKNGKRNYVSPGRRTKKVYTY